MSKEIAMIWHDLKRHGRRLGTAVAVLSLLVGFQAGAAPTAQAVSATLPVTGTLKVGDTLTMTPTNFLSSPLTFWYTYPAGGGSATEVGIETTYTLQPADVGRDIKARAWTPADGDIYSDLLGPIEAGVLTPGTPSILGSTVVGSELWVDTGTWDPTPDSFTYKWLRDGSAFGQTGDSYRLTSADVGKKLSVEVTGTKTGYDDATATSAQTAAITAVPPAAVTAFSATDVVISSGRCVSIPVTATYQVSSYEATAVTNVTLTSKVTNKHGKKIGTVTLTGSGPDYSPVGTLTPSRRAELIGTATGTFRWCTGAYLGAIRFAAPTGTWTGNYGYYSGGSLKSASVATPVHGSISGTTKATIHVRGGVRVSAGPTLKVKGTKHTLTAKFQRWMPSRNAWRPLERSKVSVQKLVDGNWVSVKTVRLSKAGKVRVSWNATEAASYRVFFAGSTITTSGASGVVTG
jgi:hypothetical protein